MLRLSLVLAALVVATPLALAEEDAAPTPVADFTPLTLAALDNHLLPRHAHLVDTAAALHGAAQTFCATPDAAGLEPLRQSYHATMAAWSGLQHITFGPVADFGRRFRLHFWPDKRNVLTRELAQLLAERPEGLFRPHGFTFTSVAVQGLPMVERLLFETPEALLGEDGLYRCRLLVAVAGNIEHTATELFQGWAEGPDSYGQAVREAATTSPLLGSSADVAGLLLTGLNSQLFSLREQRLLPVRGETMAAASPRAAENWRSGRSLADLIASLEAKEDLYRQTFLPALQAQDPERAALMERAFAQTLATARSLPVPLDQAVGEATHRATVEKLARELQALRQLAAERTARTLGLVLGFNSLDGD